MKYFRLTLILILSFLGTPLYSSYVQKATYEVSFGVLERIGTADAFLEIRDDQSYSIYIEARTEGIAKLLTNNRIEVYESHGIVQEGKLIPKKFVKIRKTDTKKRIRIYTFDHPNKKIILEDINSYDWKEEPVVYYAQEDILSLFFNLKNYQRKPKTQSLYALGGNKKDGKIDIVFADENETVQMKQTMNLEDGEFVKVILNEPIFSSEKGELYINLDKNGLCEKAVLKDVILFGDIVGQRIH